jgi:hypothetical protein
MSWRELEGRDYVLYRKGWNPDEESLLKALKTTGWASEQRAYYAAVESVSWEFVLLAPDDDGDMIIVLDSTEPGSFTALLAVFDPDAFK